MMRLASGLVLALVMSACDGGGQPGAGNAAANRPDISAEQIEAKRVCAELTGYSPVPGGAGSEETRAMREKEYKACVAAVAGGGQPELRGRSSDTVLQPAPPAH